MKYASHPSTRRLVQAVVTGLASKVSAIVLQLIAIPIAAVSIDATEFSKYSIIVANLSWLHLAQLGVGNAFSLEISEAITTGATHKVSLLFATIVWLIASLTFLAALLFLVLSAWMSGEVNYGSAQTSLLIVSIFVASMAVLPFEAAQMAQQQQHVSNLYTICGTLLAAICVVFVSFKSPSAVAFAMAAYIPVLASRFLNSVFWISRNAIFFEKLSDFSSASASKLLRTGIQISLGSSLVNFLSHVFPILLSARYMSPQYISVISIQMHLTVLFLSILSIANTPLLAALAHSHFKKDKSWLRRTYGITIAANLAMAILVSGILNAIGYKILYYWYGGTFKVEPLFFVWSSAYLITQVFDTTNHVYLTAVGQVANATKVLLLRSLVFAGALLLFIQEQSSAFPFLALFLSSLIISAPMLTLFVMKSLRTP